jgi:hypothetical protein
MTDLIEPRVDWVEDDAPHTRLFGAAFCSTEP